MPEGLHRWASEGQVGIRAGQREATWRRQLALCQSEAGERNDGRARAITGQQQRMGAALPISLGSHDRNDVLDRRRPRVLRGAPIVDGGDAGTRAGGQQPAETVMRLQVTDHTATTVGEDDRRRLPSRSVTPDDRPARDALVLDALELRSGGNVASALSSRRAQCLSPNILRGDGQGHGPRVPGSRSSAWVRWSERTGNSGILCRAWCRPRRQSTGR